MKLGIVFSLLAFSLSIQARHVAVAPAIGLVVRGGPNHSPACWTTLSCNFQAVADMPLAARLLYLQYIETRFIPLNSGTQFRALEGVMQFSISVNVGGPGTFFLYANAGIVEKIQNGGAIALGIAPATPEPDLWADFFLKMKNRQFANRNDHDRAWSLSEQASTGYGIIQAESIRPPVPPLTKQEVRLIQFTQIFRDIMRNRDSVSANIRDTFRASNPALASAAEPFVDWMTDVTQSYAARVGSAICWRLSELDSPGPGDLINNPKVMNALLPKWFKAYQDRNK